MTFYCPYCNHKNCNEEARQAHIRHVHGLTMTKKEIQEMMDLKDSGNMAISDLVSTGGPEIQVDKPNIQEPKVIWR